jgi:NDP-sugar pyrophosphorylase family protein
MNIIIPMAGLGNRFIESGYSTPKPLIKLRNKTILEYIISMYDKEDNFVFICNDLYDHNEFIYSICPNANIIKIPSHKLGPVYTVKYAFDYIKDEEEVIINYCDTALLWNYNHFKSEVRNNDLDGCILTHIGFHPHTLATTKMAFLKEKNGFVEEVKEKSSYTDNPMNEHASSGVYYFKKGSYVKKYFSMAMEKNINYNNEFYVTLAYNLLIQDNLKIGFYDTKFTNIFGTPSEIENFLAWMKILDGGQVKSIEDLINCYNYWAEYNENITNNNSV